MPTVLNPAEATAVHVLVHALRSKGILGYLMNLSLEYVPSDDAEAKHPTVEFTGEMGSGFPHLQGLVELEGKVVLSTGHPEIVHTPVRIYLNGEVAQCARDRQGTVFSEWKQVVQEE